MGGNGGAGPRTDPRKKPEPEIRPLSSLGPQRIDENVVGFLGIDLGFSLSGKGWVLTGFSGRDEPGASSSPSSQIVELFNKELFPSPPPFVFGSGLWMSASS